MGGLKPRPLYDDVGDLFSASKGKVAGLEDFAGVPSRQLEVACLAFRRSARWHRRQELLGGSYRKICALQGSCDLRVYLIFDAHYFTS